MTAKQIAICRTAKTVGVALAAGITTSVLLIYVPLLILGVGFCVVAMLGFIYLIYELELSKAEYTETLNQLKQDLSN